MVLHCATCLASDRTVVAFSNSSFHRETYQYLRIQETMIALSDVEHFYPRIPTGTLILMQLTNIFELHICWECHRRIKNMEEFRKQVALAQSILKTNSFDLSIKGIQSLSNLSKVNKIGFDMSFDQSYFDCNQKSQQNINKIKTEFIKVDIEVQTPFVKNDIPYHIHSDSDTTSITGDCDINIKADVKEENSYQEKLPVVITKKVEKQEEKMEPNSFEQLFYVSIMSEDDMRLAWDSGKERHRYKLSTYKCEKCYSGFFDSNKYKKHIELRHSEKAGSHPCDVCGVRFRSGDTLRRHRADHYQRYGCRACAYSHHSLAAMHAHLRTHDVLLYVCNICGDAFSMASHLKTHRSVVHLRSGVRPPLECDHCGRMFKCKKGIENHIVSVHMARGRLRVACPQCGKLSRNLRAHLATHAPRTHDEAAYCVECDKQYFSVALYKKHLKNTMKHRKSETIKRKCPHCDALIHYMYMKKHINRVHLREYAHKCAVCGKGFDRKSTLQTHVSERHEGVTVPKKRVLCNYCGKGFTAKSSLQQHVNSHLGRRPYECATCGDNFSYSGALYTHVKLKHGGNKQPPQDT